MADNTNYGDFIDAPTASGFDELDKLVNKQREYEEEVKRLEDEFRAAKAKLANVSERLLPDLMDEMGLEEFKTKSGFKIKINKKLRVSIAGDKKMPALQWLREHEYGDVIKQTVSIPFTVNEAEEATKLVEELKGRFRMVGKDQKVESATLTALITKLLKQGVDVPLATFGAYEQRTTKISV